MDFLAPWPPAAGDPFQTNEQPLAKWPTLGLCRPSYLGRIAIYVCAGCYLLRILSVSQLLTLN